MMYDLLDSSSGSSSSDSEDELDVLLVELATTPSRELGPHVSLDDISEIDCKLLFRYINRDRVVLEMFVFCKLFQSLLRVFFLFISLRLVYFYRSQIWKGRYSTPPECFTITRMLHMSKWHVCHSHGGFTDIAAQISLSKSLVWTRFSFWKSRTRIEHHF